MSNSAKHRAKHAMKKKRSNLFVRILKWGIAGLALLILLGVGVFSYYAATAPNFDATRLKSGGSSTILAANGSIVTRLGGENRAYVENANIPQSLKDAVTSIEDRHFYSEPFGLNPVRTVEAAWYNLLHRGQGGLQGGSTLTQQLVKLSFFSTSKADQTLKRKAQEAWLTVQVEQHYTKDQIFEFYINKVYMDNGVYGMQTAADYYYGKKLAQLSLSQIALLAGMPQAPITYDPYVNPQKAKYRRDLVLQAMYRNNEITKQQETTAIATPITSGLVDKAVHHDSLTNNVIADSYIGEVIKQVQKDGFDPYRDNLKIRTNLDMDAQKHIYTLVNSSDVAFPDNKLQVGISVVNPKNGQIVAMVGGRKTGNVLLGLNRATQTSRSSGSTIKPILDYGPAIQYLYWATNHKLDDSKYTYPGTDIQLYDWDKQYLGDMTMRYALVQSRNVPAVKTLNEVGLNQARSFARNLGINIPSSSGLSVGIGANISSLQMAAAYAAFANGGTYYKPTYIREITTSDGLKHYYSANGEEAMSSSTAYMITDMLKGVITNGTGTSAQIAGLYQAAKTGTTDYSDDEIAANSALTNTVKDSWFSGYTKNYAISIWTGYDHPLTQGIPTSEETIAALLYRNIQAYLSQNVTNEDWTQPDSVGREGDVLYVNGYKPDSVSNSNDSSESSSSSSSDSSSSSSSESSSSSSSSDSSSSSSNESSSSSSSSDSSSSSSTSTPSSSNDSSSSNSSTSSSSSTTNR